MDRWVEKNAIVNGINSEVGKAIAQQLLDSGVNVVGVDKNPAKEILKGKGKFYFKQYNACLEDDVWDLFMWIEQTLVGVDVLINNSSTVEKQTILQGKKDTWSDLVNSNILSYALLTKEFLRTLIDRDIEVGHVINVASFYGQRVPLDASLSFYTATQHAVLNYNEHLRQELELIDSCVRVTAISPRYDPESVKASGVSSKDIADAVAYALNAPLHVQVYDLVLEPFEQYE